MFTIGVKTLKSHFAGTSESFLLKSESLSSLTEGELRFRCDSDAASDISSVQVIS